MLHKPGFLESLLFHEVCWNSRVFLHIHLTRLLVSRLSAL